GFCEPTTGVCSNPNAANGTTCTDNNACTGATGTADQCQNGVCQPGTATVCTALDSCHVAGTCDTTTGVCSNPHAPDGTTCSDLNACTQTDSCLAGVCVGSNPVVCGCPQATCNPANGLCSPACPRPCPSAKWAKSIDSPVPGGVALDQNGSVYVAGAF